MFVEHWRAEKRKCPGFLFPLSTHGPLAASGPAHLLCPGTGPFTAVSLNSRTPRKFFSFPPEVTGGRAAQWEGAEAVSTGRGPSTAEGTAGGRGPGLGRGMWASLGPLPGVPASGPGLRALWRDSRGTPHSWASEEQPTTALTTEHVAHRDGSVELRPRFPLRTKDALGVSADAGLFRNDRAVPAWWSVRSNIRLSHCGGRTPGWHVRNHGPHAQRGRMKTP